MDQVATYLNALPGITETTVASTMLESFISYYQPKVIKHHYEDYDDIVVNYILPYQ